jgi:hypothetical protein
MFQIIKCFGYFTLHYMSTNTLKCIWIIINLEKARTSYVATLIFLIHENCLSFLVFFLYLSLLCSILHHFQPNLPFPFYVFSSGPAAHWDTKQFPSTKTWNAAVPVRRRRRSRSPRMPRRRPAKESFRAMHRCSFRATPLACANRLTAPSAPLWRSVVQAHASTCTWSP